VVLFTDARSLSWVFRNREYNIACNGLVNKLAKIQQEIPHKIFSVPSDVNSLANLFSRSFLASRFPDKEFFSLSKIQAIKVPPLPIPACLRRQLSTSFLHNRCKLKPRIYILGRETKLPLRSQLSHSTKFLVTKHLRRNIYLHSACCNVGTTQLFQLKMSQKLP
jgi:hypothetical protein